MGKGKWILRVIQSGPVIEKVLFKKGYPCLLDGITPVQGGTSAKKRLQNEYAAEKALARLLNANFAEGDSFGTLTYSQPGLKKLKQSIPGLTFKSNKGIRLDDHMKLWLAADKQLRNVLDIARRECHSMPATRCPPIHNSVYRCFAKQEICSHRIIYMKLTIGGLSNVESNVTHAYNSAGI